MTSPSRAQRPAQPRPERGAMQRFVSPVRTRRDRGTSLDLHRTARTGDHSRHGRRWPTALCPGHRGREGRRRPRQRPRRDSQHTLGGWYASTTTEPSSPGPSIVDGDDQKPLRAVSFGFCRRLCSTARLAVPAYDPPHPRHAHRISSSLRAPASPHLGSVPVSGRDRKTSRGNCVRLKPAAAGDRPRRGALAGCERSRRELK
jgi:hypothetical protein